jgi:uncharacterized membrane protein YhdT
MLPWSNLIRKLSVWSDTQPAPEFASAQAEPDYKALAHLVPRKFESLEVWLLLFCGAYGLLAATWGMHGAIDIALACVVMLCLGVWRRYHPARNKTQWALSASVSLLLVGWVIVNPHSGGITGPFFFLLLFLAVCYPLLMDVFVLTVFTCAILALYFVVGWGVRSQLSIEIYVLRGLMLGVMCVLSGRFGMVLRQSELGIDRLRRDIASQAYNEHGLARYGARLLHACANEMQPCTLVLLPLPMEWHAPIDVSGRGSDYSAVNSLKLQTRALREMALHLTLALPNDSVVSRNAQGDWVVLVPWLDRQTVLNRLESVFGRPIQLPFGPRNEEMFVAITACAVVSNGASDSVEKMVSRAQDIWLRGVRTGAVDTGY